MQASLVSRSLSPKKNYGIAAIACFAHAYTHAHSKQ
jgi:hypothetical protein